MKKLIRWCLVNLRWIMIAVIAINILPIIEKGTNTGLDDETAFWSTIVVIATVGLFAFNKKYQSALSKYFPK